MEKRGRKIKIFSLIMYTMIFVCFFIPWMEVGKEHYSVITLALSLPKENYATFFDSKGILYHNATTLMTGIKVGLGIYAAFFGFSVLYTLTVLFNKDWNLNILTVLCGILLAYTGSFDSMLGSICTNKAMASIAGLGFFGIAGLELFFRKAAENWSETVSDAKYYEDKARREKEERQKRLFFPGKYNKLFYRVVLKNFKNNVRDYLMLLSCNTLVFMFVFTGFGLFKIIGNGQQFYKMGKFVGASRILFDSIIELGIVGVFMLVLLLLYYLRKRIPEYGVFRTLGIRKDTLYSILGIEIGVGILISLIVGCALGIIFTCYLYSKTAGKILALGELLGWISPLIFLKAFGVMFVLYLITFFVTHELFSGFRMGSLTDLQMMREWRPQNYQMIAIAAGIAVSGFTLLRYSKNYNAESLKILLGVFVGVYIFIRMGTSLWISRWKKQTNHLLTLLPKHPFVHRSRSATWYMFGLSVMQICILGIFSVQLFSCSISGPAEKLYPYDMVCLANDENEEDQEFLGKLEEKGANVYTYPMVRVSGTDATLQSEGGGQPLIFGQQIGISETTYHALKKQINPNYQKVDLGLGDSEEFVYIVHQQDQSDKAQPIDYKISRVRPYLYPGPVCEYVDTFANNTNYRRYRIIGEEIDSLTGIFCDGERENLVVFSDAYFEIAKNLWKTTDMFTGEIIKDDGTYLGDGMVRQGPSQLVLVKTQKDVLTTLAKEIEDFKIRHKDDEHYDAQIESVYFKEALVKNLSSKLEMKRTMAMLLIASFFVACVLLMTVKLLTEKRIAQKRTEFLISMGMRRKERYHLVRYEIGMYIFIVSMVSFYFSTAIVLATMYARCYVFADMKALMARYLPLAAVELFALAIVFGTLASLQIRQLEKGAK